MKHWAKLGSCVLGIGTIWSFVARAQSHRSQVPHYDLEMTSNEYANELKIRKLTQVEDASDVGTAIAWGTKNLSWLAAINSQRDPSRQLQLTSPGSQRGIPIDKPNQYGPKTISDDLALLQAELPAEYKQVLESDLPVPNSTQIPDEEFLVWARKINRLYETAARWRLLSPYKDGLALRKKNDVRGYYFLEKLENKEEVLKNLSSQDLKLQEDVKSWLKILCSNSGLAEGDDEEFFCQQELSRLLSQNQDLNPFYVKQKRVAKENYDSFFNIRNARSDLQWNASDQTTALFPFLKPETQAIQDFLKINIEDEWKWSDWKLLLSFGNPKASAKVVFEPGATPNVNGLGGNIITMDKNVPITEYNVRWTIRHEFGHVLGFPDCYLEFYEPEIDLMINYQIDTSHLMCSRVGKFSESMYENMKRVYLKP